MQGNVDSPLVQNKGKSYRQQRREEATYVENMGQELGPRNWKTHLCENWSRGAKRGRVRSSLVTQGIHRHEDKHTAERACERKATR